MYVTIAEYAKINNLSVLDVVQEVKEGKLEAKNTEEGQLIFVSDEIAYIYTDKSNENNLASKPDNYTQAYGIVYLYVILGWLAVIAGFGITVMESWRLGFVVIIVGLITVGLGQMMKAGLDTARNIRSIKDYLVNEDNTD